MGSFLDERIAAPGDATFVASLLGGDAGVLLFDDSTRAGRRTVLAPSPIATYDWSQGEGRLHRQGDAPARRDDPFAAIREMLGPTRPRPRQAPFFAGGLAGYLGYGLRTSIDDLPDTAPRESRLPDVYLEDHRLVLEMDEEKRPGEIRLFALDCDDGVRAQVDEIVRRLAGAPGRTEPSASPRKRPVVLGLDRDGHHRRVASILESIRRGDVYQVNLTHRMLRRETGAPLAVFERLRRRHPAAYAAHLPLSSAAVISFSPELFLDVDGDRARTGPIKGTAPRHPNPAEDARRAAALVASEKDRAELAMIVDLLRNDFAKVCRAGTIRVVEHAALRTVPTVHHLYSVIEGRLDDGFDVVDLVRSTFPCGSVTGAPKRAAMEAIDALETVARGVYTGAIGFFGRDGRSTFSVAIRTLVLEDGYARIHAGGGIVIDSEPHLEWEESLAKVRGLLAALGDET